MEQSGRFAVVPTPRDAGGSGRLAPLAVRVAPLDCVAVLDEVRGSAGRTVCCVGVEPGVFAELVPFAVPVVWAIAMLVLRLTRTAKLNELIGRMTDYPR